jgi:hypothetical protein
LVENRPTQTTLTCQPNRPKPTVADTAKKEQKKNNNKEKSVVVKGSSHKTLAQVDPSRRTFNEPAIKTSDTNWDRLENAYKRLA